MRIVKHKLEGAAFNPAKLTGGVIVPEIVVLHDTAGRLDPLNSAQYLAETPKASVHFVVERDGVITQLVPTNRRAGHAGQSHFHGRADCNAFSVGIEIVNPGKLTRTSGGGAMSWWGQDFGFGAFNLAELETKEHGKGVWMPYTEAQISAVHVLLLALFDNIKTLKDITTHWYISPGRKIDTNPLFPLESLRARILGREDPAMLDAEATSEAVESGAYYVRIIVPGSTLNIRRYPSFNPNVIATVSHGAELPLLRRGVFDGRVWNCVLFDGREGWVLDRYAPTIHVNPNRK